MARQADAQTELLHSVWRKAFEDGEVVLKLESKSDLTNLRFKLYNVSSKLKRQADKGVVEDLDLQSAVENCSISTAEVPAGFFLRVYRTDKSKLMQNVAAQIGAQIKMPESAATANEEIEDSFARIQAMMGGKG